MAAVRALLHEAKVYIGIARVGDPDHRLHETVQGRGVAAGAGGGDQALTTT